ncbi:MAG: hypothetical protein N3B18_07235 [Desulfobacterota bacterium]|nr:hypothetical protein [Thermodesulfobacteriota bacterium]
MEEQHHLASPSLESPGLKKFWTEHHPDISLTKCLNVEYVHAKTSDGGDLYVTRHGMPFIRHLFPENWYTGKWFRANRERLQGTSTIYRVTTREIGGRSLDLVVKWCRFGQDVPLETRIIENVLNAEFNSPFEEFALVEELRAASNGTCRTRIMLQKPLAIYVPPEKLQLWQTGRSRHKIISKIAKHPGVEIDILRQYILIYKWVHGVDAVEAFERTGIPEQELALFTERVIAELREKGFRVLDQKPAHFIVRIRPDGTIMKDKQNRYVYTLVDFELLQRTPEHEQEVQTTRRVSYLVKQRDRFKDNTSISWPQHLKPVNILGVDYVWGLTESTSGTLWVVGHDPDLFDYFQPERWRKTPRTKLSPTDDIYYTKTKDNINIVWKISKVGELPDPAADEAAHVVSAYGYNSPFEEFAIAFELSRSGIPTVYPRAIYMTGLTAGASSPPDLRRFRSHHGLLTPDGEPILRSDHDYITVWGFWNGPDESLAEKDGDYYTGINALNALRRGLITNQEFIEVMAHVKSALAAAGFEDLSLKGTHVLLSINPQGLLMRNHEGIPDFRICNFETMRRIA